MDAKKEFLVLDFKSFHGLVAFRSEPPLRLNEDDAEVFCAISNTHDKRKFNSMRSTGFLSQT
jgi:hypothetical protein